MHGGPKHGPYYARYWWHDGRRYKRYVRQQDVVAAQASCTQRRASERDERAQAETAHRAWREVRELLRGIEHGEY